MRIDRITYIGDAGDPALNLFAGAREPQLRHWFEPHGGLFIAESPMIVSRALDAGCRPYSVLIEDRCIEREEYSALLHRLREAAPALPIHAAPHALLTRITGYELTRGLLCAMHRPEERSAADICQSARRSTVSEGEERSAAGICRSARRIAVLEDVENPTNVGAIFRSAAALGLDAVLLAGGTADPLQRRALRTGMGAPLLLPWAYLRPGQKIKAGIDTNRSDVSVNNTVPADETPMASLPATLRSMGYVTASMALREDSLPLQQIRRITDAGANNDTNNDIKKERGDRLAILLGNEGHGLTDLTIRESDYVFRIPMYHGVDSLNVAAAAAVVFYELARPSAPHSTFTASDTPRAHP